ncbi:cytochrome c-type biogenesis protein [Oceanibaculum indicum]|uniref:Cytochrome c-type biogenesis protein n=1 Tax=Oceanibaculum indicum TaxID=526216 RepID=A0A420WRB7_9PROT|nr:cytochrome c-type biogenesis protein [Oceanibaculum indicum]RKQ73598.1 cytochrome c-type biogenesis protein CcmH [Oceanibaculum indicum]
MRRLVLALLFVLLLPVSAQAVKPDEMLADPALESRAREIGKELRCLVCQNESIDESNAELARDLRLLVRERLKQGDSNDDVREFVVQRYGDFVLLKPPVKPSTWILWYGPAGILLLGAIGVLFYLRGSRKAAEAVPAGAVPLDPEERKRLDALMAEDESK